MKTPDNGGNTEQALRFAQLEIRMLREQLAKALDDAKAGRSTGPAPNEFVPPPPPFETEQEIAPNDSGSISVLTGGGRRILCVEDSEANFQLIETILSDQPETELTWAETGQKGIDLALTAQPQLILLDLDLPDMHGSQVLAQLRSASATATIPVIIISADATSNQIERMLSAGARDYLTKPFEVRRFLLMLDEIFQQK
jgi:CheY-like chemotaxis protein